MESGFGKDDEEAHLFIPLARETVELLATRPDPLVAVKKVAWMKQWVEDVMEEYVVEARSLGYRWDAIAEALGVSRQAAWQRYRSEDTEQSRRASTTNDFLRAENIWSILVRHMRAGQWYDLPDIYSLVSASASISDADLEPDAPGSSGARWQRNVRNVLQRRKSVGDIEWDGRARYQLP